MKRFNEVIELAEQILEAEGYDAVTMRNIAQRLNIKAPSLYKHMAGKDDILVALQEKALNSMGDALNVSDGSLAGIAAAYRKFALAHPKLYEIATSRPLERDRLTPGVEDRAALPLLTATNGDINMARAVWSVAHGLVDLELRNRFPEDADVDAAWQVAIMAFDEQLQKEGYNEHKP